MRWLAGLFLVAHGLVHLAIWLPRHQEGAPMDPGHSPFLGDVRAASVVLAVIAAVAFVVAGIGVLLATTWWAPVAIGAAAVSLALVALTFTPWWLFAVVIDVAVIVLAWRAR